MKNILNLSAVLFSALAFSQVAIGKPSISTLSDNSPNTSISLEFGTGNKGIILPWVTSQSAVTGAVNGTLIYDTSDKKVKVKQTSGWKDLTLSTNGVVNTTLQDLPLQDLPDAKTQIGGNPQTDITPGILVLAETNKAMVLPKTTYQSIVNPEPGTMIYDTTANQLAVYNGTVWSFWKP